MKKKSSSSTLLFQFFSKAYNSCKRQIFPFNSIWEKPAPSTECHNLEHNHYRHYTPEALGSSWFTMLGVAVAIVVLIYYNTSHQL